MYILIFHARRQYLEIEHVWIMQTFFLDLWFDCSYAVVMVGRLFNVYAGSCLAWSTNFLHMVWGQSKGLRIIHCFDGIVRLFVNHTWSNFGCWLDTTRMGSTIAENARVGSCCKNAILLYYFPIDRIQSDRNLQCGKG